MRKYNEGLAAWKSVQSTKEVYTMYHVEPVKDPKGYAYVVDYQGNKVYYGSISDCRQCVEELNNSNGGEINED